MNIKSLLTAFLLITFSGQVSAQKIKYKDLFVLLNAHQFPQSEPFLKKYLKDNDDNPNAYLFMGMIYQEKAAKLDILRESEAQVVQLDSAAYFYDKAMKGMTEKEVSRNEEYYQMYNRRDLRTGKFGVKLSDVQLDIENRMKLKDRAKLIVILKSQFVAAEKYYQRTQKLFLEIRKSYPGQKEFYLRANDSLISQLRTVSQLYDSCHVTFNDYKSTAQAIGKISYNQDIDPVDIVDFSRDGTTPADFYRDDLKLWDYKRWALSSVETIEREIAPLRDQLVALDVELNQLQQKLKKDSVSLRSEVAAVKSKMSFPALIKIDSHPLPLKVFDMKISELEYGSQLVENRPLRDSVDVLKHINAIKGELLLARKMDSLAGVFSDQSLDNEVENYQHFVTHAYGTPVVLKSLVKATKEFGIREVVHKEDELRRKNESLRWIIDGADSIPLFNDVAPTSRFKPLILLDDNLTAGLQYADSLATGYFYTIVPSRMPAAKASYPVDKQAFKKRNLPFIKAINTADDKSLVYFILYFSETRIKNKVPATLVKIYRQEGLAWSINYSFDQQPSELVFSAETFELSVKTKSSLGEVFGVTFDKNGKLMK